MSTSKDNAKPEEHYDVAVIGLCSGTAIADKLALHGAKVVGLDKGSPKASSLNNQMWKHSGAHYMSGELAQKLWWAYANMDPLEHKHLLNKGAHFLTLSEQTAVQREAVWDKYGIPFKRIKEDYLSYNGALGCPKYVGGFLAYDSVVDFRAMLPELRCRAQQHGTKIIESASVRRILCDANSVVGLVYEVDGETKNLRTRHVVVAAGCWAPEILSDIGISLPVRRVKSHVLTLEGELVPHLTVYLDPPNLTLVPYKSRTLVADTGRIAVEDPEDREVVPEAEEELKEGLVTCFPSMKPEQINAVQVHACVKTEADIDHTGSRNQKLAVFDESFHGVRGLRIVFPGKLSLLFSLADEVSERIIKELWA